MPPALGRQIGVDGGRRAIEWQDPALHHTRKYCVDRLRQRGPPGPGLQQSDAKTEFRFRDDGRA
jgi:hypothetical protein